MLVFGQASIDPLVAITYSPIFTIFLAMMRFLTNIQQHPLLLPSFTACRVFHRQEKPLRLFGFQGVDGGDVGKIGVAGGFAVPQEWRRQNVPEHLELMLGHHSWG